MHTSVSWQWQSYWGNTDNYLMNDTKMGWQTRFWYVNIKYIFYFLTLSLIYTPRSVYFVAHTGLCVLDSTYYTEYSNTKYLIHAVENTTHCSFKLLKESLIFMYRKHSSRFTNQLMVLSAAVRNITTTAQGERMRQNRLFSSQHGTEVYGF